MLLFISTFTEEERLDAFFNPANLMISEEFADKNKDEVLFKIMENGTAYPTQISRMLGLHFETVNKILFLLHKEGLIEKHACDRWYPSPMIRSKIPEMWGNNLDSYEKISRCGWIIPTIKGIEYAKTKYAGSSKKISSTLVYYYGLKVEEDIPRKKTVGFARAGG